MNRPEHDLQQRDKTITAVNSRTGPDPWILLRSHTPARIALGRTGASLPTAELLDFAMAHARARDAVHLPLDTGALAAALEQEGFASQVVRSRTADRAEYLRRPDLGRRIAPECQQSIVPTDADEIPLRRLTIVIGDGLASLAATRHAVPMLAAFRQQLARNNPQVGTGEPCDAKNHWALDTVFIATQARVALADEIGAIRQAEAVVMMLGERPGLSAPDSLGVYLTYAPRAGRTDAERNCISNIRNEGLSYEESAYRLHYLLQQCRLAGTSGVSVRDSSEWQPTVPLL